MLTYGVSETEEFAKNMWENTEFGKKYNLIIEAATYDKKLDASIRAIPDLPVDKTKRIKVYIYEVYFRLREFKRPYTITPPKILGMEKNF